jgi:uncharacterized LabA/DUF88 family protein
MTASGGVIFLCSLYVETQMSQQQPSPHPPTLPKAVSFFDGQNLYRSAKRVYGYIHPNYDPQKLAQQICSNQGWQLVETRFYTGFPNPGEDPFWNHFWRAKFAQMKRDGVFVFSRDLRYQDEQITLPTGQTYTIRTRREKGVDVRIAVDVIRLAHQRVYDIALLFSQDQDLSEVAKEIRVIALEQNRWIKIASAFPCASNPGNRGINLTDWIKIDKPTYDLCIDPRDYRPPRLLTTP